MADIYEQHDKTFQNVSAAVIVRDGQKIGTIAFKIGKTGRVTCYLHVLGCEMVRGHADGGGYDKFSAAAYNAAQRDDFGRRGEFGDGVHMTAQQIREAIQDTGRCWNDDLHHAGFTVWEAV